MANSIEQEMCRRTLCDHFSIRMPARQRWLRSSFYGGNQYSAGSVKEGKLQTCSTDWMEIEKKVSLSLLLYYSLNTKEMYHPWYTRTWGFQKMHIVRLVAADCAIMVIDCCFKVWKDRNVKLYLGLWYETYPDLYIYRQDGREAKDTFDLLERYRESLRIETYPINWPIEHLRENLGCIRACIKKYLEAVSPQVVQKKQKKRSFESRWW